MATWISAETETYAATDSRERSRTSSMPAAGFFVAWVPEMAETRGSASTRPPFVVTSRRFLAGRRGRTVERLAALLGDSPGSDGGVEAPQPAVGRRSSPASL